jgi:hypothetical protein
MIHGVYVRSRPKNKWHLVSVAVSPELATQDLKDALAQAQREGNELAEAAIQVFDSPYFIPETLNEVKKDKPLFN